MAFLAGCSSPEASSGGGAGAVPYALEVPVALPLPYSELEAEDGAGTGTLSVFETSLHTPGAEASGRRYVSLAPGQAWSWTVPQTADSLVARVSVPDSVDGQGQDASLDILQGNTVVGNLAVTSRYSWEYGTPRWGTTDVWPDLPASGLPRHFWDEASTRLSANLETNSEVTLRNSSSLTILIDLIDLESVPAPVARPAGSVSVADFGAVADGVTDDTGALQAALTAAAGGILFIPEGTYLVRSLTVGNVNVQGSGLWRTRLVGPESRFRFSGGKARVADLAVFGETSVRNDFSDSENAFSGNPGPDSLIERVWVEHKKCAFWVGVWNNQLGPTRLRITEGRLRNLMADAVNFCSGTTQSMVDNTLVRGTGDDALAGWSPLSGGPSGGNNTWAFNHVQSPWVASGIALYGGGPFRVEGNTIRDTVTTGSGLYVSSNFGAHPFTGALELRNNLLIRAGAHESDPGGTTGAIRVLAADKDMTGATIAFTDNAVVDPLESAVSIQGPWNVGKLTFSGLSITNAPYVADVKPNAKGSAVFSDVTMTGSTLGWRNSAGAAFSLTNP